MRDRGALEGPLHRTPEETKRRLDQIEARLASSKPALGPETREQLLRTRAQLKKEIGRG